MNREIKFRGISVDTGEWVYGSMVRGVGELVDRVYVVPAIITGYYSVYSMMDCIEVDPSTVGQYTGVKDMHGVEIYEGDLAPCIYHFTGCNGVLEVIYNEYRASFMVKHHGDCQQKMVEKLISDFARQTIIGNIHQHPELLNS